jgi:hypothetical protein
MYTLDKTAAMNADKTSNWLTDTGKYIGRILCGEDIKASNGTRGIALTLQADDGRETRQFIYTVKSDGEKLSGYDLVMALMTCLRLRDIKPVNGPVKRWDSDAKQEYTEQGTVFPELTNKPIGFLLQKTEEPSRKHAGETAWSAKLIAVFDPQSELMAAEILTGKKDPVMLAQKVASLADRPMKSKPAARSSAPVGGGGADLDDDIPFGPAYARAAWSVI